MTRALHAQLVARGEARPAFGRSAGGNAGAVSEIPEKRQSVRSPGRLILGVLLMLAVLAAVWIAVAAAY